MRNKKRASRRVDRADRYLVYDKSAREENSLKNQLLLSQLEKKVKERKNHYFFFSLLDNAGSET